MKRPGLTLALLLAAAAGCVRPMCHDNTFFLSLVFDGDAATANRLVFTVVSADRTVIGAAARSSGGFTDSVELAFNAGFPRAQTVTVDVRAQVGERLVGFGRAQALIANSCEVLSIEIMPAGQDGGISDLGTDFALLPPDLSLPTLFAAAGSIPGLGAPPFVVAGDVDRDGRLDLVTRDHDHLAVLGGRGDGTFKGPVASATGAGLRHAALADWTLDGRLDLAAADPSAHSLALLAGKGDGSFGVPATIASNDGPIAFGDFNRDGLPDFAVGSAMTVNVYLGKPGGNFAFSIAVGNLGNLPTVADWNRDGRPDLAVNSTFKPLYILLGNGDGTFQAPMKTFNFPDRVAAADLDGDGRLDLAGGSDGPPSTGYAIALGNGDGTFQAPSLTQGPAMSGVAAGDLDGDGRLDLAFALPSGAAGVLFGKGTGTFLPLVTFVAGAKPGPPVLGDWNRDGRLDLALPNSGDGSLSIFLNLSTPPKVFQVSGFTSVVTSKAPAHLASADLNRDGVADLIALSDAEGYVIAGRGDGTFEPAVALFAGKGPHGAPAVGDWNRDGRIDLAVPNQGDSTLSTLAGNGDGTFQGAINLGLAGIPGGVESGDWNGDGKPDLVVAIPAAGKVAWLAGRGDGSFAGSTLSTAAPGANAIVAGDWNSDGHLDVATANGDSTLSVLFGNGNGSFQAPMPLTAAAGTVALAAGDWNNDDKLDLAVACHDGNVVEVLLGNGAGRFLAPVPIAAAQPSALAVSDFDADGRADLAVSLSSQNQVAVFHGRGDGTFQLLGGFPSGMALPSSLICGDWNRDGRPDLAVANHEMGGDVTILLNTSQ